MSQIDSNDTARPVALGFAQRKSLVFYAWFLPLSLAFGGLGYALPALIANDTKDVETGVILILMGLAFSAFWWLVTLGIRFTKKKPKAVQNVPLLDTAIRQHRTLQNLRTVAVLLVSGSLLFLMPKGLTQDGISIVAVIVGTYIPIYVALEYWYRMVTNCEQYYQEWLQKQ